MLPRDLRHLSGLLGAVYLLGSLVSLTVADVGLDVDVPMAMAMVMPLWNGSEFSTLTP